MKTITRSQRVANRLQIIHDVTGISLFDIDALMTIEAGLRRWHEAQCGDSNNYASWAIELNEEDDKYYRCVYPYKGKSYQTRVNDRGAMYNRKIEAILKPYGLGFYIQSDPRGCALYVERDGTPLTYMNYSQNGIAIYRD